MAAQVITVVSAVVDDGESDLLQSLFAELLRQPLPEGLLRTELLRGSDRQWRIQSLWRDRAALEAMRAAGPPAAPALFRRVGAEPDLTILEVVAASQVDAAGTGVA